MSQAMNGELIRDCAADVELHGATCGRADLVHVAVHTGNQHGSMGWNGNGGTGWSGAPSAVVKKGNSSDSNPGLLEKLAACGFWHGEKCREKME